VRPDWLWRSATPVCAVSVEPWDPQWSGDLPLTVPAPRLSVAQRQDLWQPVLGELASSREVTSMPLSPEQIATVGRHAAATAALHGEGEVSIERVRHSARTLSRGRSVRASAGTSATLDDLVLPAQALGEVKRLLDWARYRDEVVAMGPLHGKGGKGIGICALFSGAPGTGKTLAAHVIADSLGMDLYQVDLSSVVDKYIGETEKNLERVFVEAEATNAVLFFDEADALFGSRSEVKDAKDRYANQEIAYLLQRMEQFDGITVLASNLRGNLDPAFSRRLHFMIGFPDPDEPTRRRLWTHHLDGLALDEEDVVDLDWLAENVQLAGGDIRNMVLAAVYAAVAEGVALGMRHVDDAVRREHIKLGRRPPAR
jgi:SpoVK/Ycf46/Vps4 family AAA+-type ATPase